MTNLLLLFCLLVVRITASAVTSSAANKEDKDVMTTSDSIATQTELDAQCKEIKELFDEDSQSDVEYKAFSTAIKRGLWSCAKSLAKRLQSNQAHVDLLSAFEMETRGVMQEVASLKQQIVQDKPVSVNAIAPAFQWAQVPYACHLFSCAILCSLSSV